MPLWPAHQHAYLCSCRRLVCACVRARARMRVQNGFTMDISGTDPASICTSGMWNGCRKVCAAICVRNILVSRQACLCERAVRASTMRQ